MKKRMKNLNNKFKRFLKNFLKTLRRPEMSILPGHLAFFFVLSVVPILTLISYGASYLHISADFLATIYKNPNSNYFRRRIKAIIMTGFIVTLFIFILLVPVFGNMIVDAIKFVDLNPYVSLKIEQVFNLLKGPVSWFVMFMFIKIIYTMAPDRKLPSSCTTYGAIFTTIVWIIITAIYSYYITHFAKYDLFYGGLANLVILMLWVYFLAYVFVIGMCLNHNKEIEKLEKTGEINIK